MEKSDDMKTYAQASEPPEEAGSSDVHHLEWQIRRLDKERSDLLRANLELSNRVKRAEIESAVARNATLYMQSEGSRHYLKMVEVLDQNTLKKARAVADGEVARLDRLFAGATHDHLLMAYGDLVLSLYSVPGITPRSKEMIENFWRRNPTKSMDPVTARLASAGRPLDFNDNDTPPED